MFAGFVGKNYQPDKDILIIGINPGGGSDKYMRTKEKEDEIFYRPLRDFKSTDPRVAKAILTAFEKINDTFLHVVKKWNLRNILDPTLNAAKTDINSIAYINVVPYRTREDKLPPSQARSYSWTRIVEPSLDILRPNVVITLGKKAHNVIHELLQEDVKYFCIPRTIGDTYISNDAKKILGDIQQYFK